VAANASIGCGEHRREVRVGAFSDKNVHERPQLRGAAALLAGGPGSALAGACVLVLWGIWRRWPRQLEVVLNGDRRPTGLIVHQSDTLLPQDIVKVQDLRVTSPARTLLDTATRLNPTQLTRAINDLRLRDLLTVDQLADVIDRNPTHRAVSLLRPHLEFAQPEPTRSVLEDRFLPLLRRHGLPTPLINVHVAGHRVDAYFPDHRLVVELDGWGSHRTKHAFVNDRRRDFEILAETGIPTVRLASEDVVDAVIPQLLKALSLAFRRCVSGSGS
jgi:hypothetical protein